MRIGIAANHAGFQLKEDLAELVRELEHQLVDFGAASLQPDDDYPNLVVLLADAVRAGDSIVANNVTGVRAGLCQDTYSVHQGVEHDDMNILVRGARVIGQDLARELVSAFLAAHFAGEVRHLRRLDKVNTLERRHDTMKLHTKD